MIALVENAIIARLDAASRLNVLGYALRTVETLPVDLDKQLGAAVQQYPAMWVAYGGWKVLESYGDGSAKVRAMFHVVVAAENLRGEREQRHGVAGEPGSYQMQADAVGLLVGQDFGLPIGGLALGDSKTLYTGELQGKRRCSLMAVAFTSDMLIDPTEPGPLVTPPVGDFETFNVAWDLPPAGGAVNAASTITLPIQES